VAGKHTKISQHARNAYALGAITAVLDELWMKRHSPECATVEDVRRVRQEAIDKIRELLP
jgi:hypothetical protein